MSNLTQAQTIRTLRLAAGLSYEQLAAYVSLTTGRIVSSRAAVQWEWRGVKNGELEEALSSALGVTVQAIRDASKASRISPGPALPRGGRRKTSQKNNHSVC